MYTFIISLITIILGFFLYGTLVEKVFRIQPNRHTPAINQADGVDYVPMSGWRIFLVQFLNIAGLGPIYGCQVRNGFVAMDCIWYDIRRCSTRLHYRNDVGTPEWCQSARDSRLAVRNGCQTRFAPLHAYSAYTADHGLS